MARAKSRTEIASLARAHTDTVINMLVGIVTREDASPTARIMAGLALLDRGWGKPLQKIELDDDRPRLVEIINTIVEPKPYPDLVPQQPGRRLPNWDYERYGDPDAPVSAPEASEAVPETPQA